MMLKKKVLLNTAVSMTLLFSGLVFLAYSQARSVELARAVAGQPAAQLRSVPPAEAMAELERRSTLAWRVAVSLIVFVLLERSFVIFGSLLPFATSVQDLRQRTRRIAAGDLRGREQAVQNNEIGQVESALDEMKAELAAMVREVAHTAQAVEDAAHALRGCNQDLATRTEQQAASLQQTAASMREFAGSLKRNALGAQQARELTQNARATAQHGGQIVAGAIATMSEISQGSHRMDEIITVIDAIAFQTNVLALNAAVEAARAGEQGRGFGVVASEVRSLAQRSAAAAKEVRELISRSREQVSAGVASVQQADDNIGSVVGAVLGTHEQVSEIAAVCAEQALAVEQIDATVEQLQSVTSQNSVLVQQGAAIAESLSERAQQLVRLMERFQLEESAVVASLQQPQQPAIAYTDRSM